MKKFGGENVCSTESHVILGGGVAVCLLLSAHRAVIIAIAQLFVVLSYFFCFRSNFTTAERFGRANAVGVNTRKC